MDPLILYDFQLLGKEWFVLHIGEHSENLALQ